ncbi:uncharacterized protein LOC131678993 [Topomyia yanbarensis]|uniref:uncharacterized protein LOC131678993 n=1 Tax=Topomyia yanbarensis TaxID=2498891 RepID=UPI00273AA4D2|nr:uncharacterized protein LOC131678993 [Topomyia yanbarensis]
MSSHRVSLLKLIDLAIGFPVSGSVSFNLLHKILYILAIRDRSEAAECDEIELSTSSDFIAVALAGNKDRDEVSQTRLMVQRVLSGTEEEHLLKITGSRIVIPWEDRRPAAADSERIETRMSAMSSVVSELEEKVQEITRKPTDNCDKIVKQLEKRIETLEGLVEQQTTKVSIEDFHQPESAAVGASSVASGGQGVDHDDTSEIWKAIRSLQNTIGTLFSLDAVPSVMQIAVEEDQAESHNQEPTVLVQEAKELERRSKETEVSHTTKTHDSSDENPLQIAQTQHLKDEKNSQMTKLLRVLQNQQAKFEEALTDITDELDKMRQSNQRLQAEQKALSNQITQGIQKPQTMQKTQVPKKTQDSQVSQSSQKLQDSNQAWQDVETLEGAQAQENKALQNDPAKQHGQITVAPGSQLEHANAASQSIEFYMDRLQDVQSCTSRIDRLENLVSRLFQEKADDVNIESRVRQSIQLASKQSRPSIAPVPGVSAEMFAQTRQLLEDRIAALWEQLQTNAIEITALQEALLTKTSEDLLLSFAANTNDQIRRLKADMQAFSKLAEIRDDRAAGTKMKPLLNVQCISCDRDVPMKACEEVIPFPPAVGPSRKLKPSLRYRLQEIRQGFKQHAGSAARNMDNFEIVYRELAEAKAKRTK